MTIWAFWGILAPLTGTSGTTLEESVPPHARPLPSAIGPLPIVAGGDGRQQLRRAYGGAPQIVGAGSDQSVAALARLPDHTTTPNLLM